MFVSGFEDVFSGLVSDRLLVGPARRGDAPPKIGELFFRNVDAEGAYLGTGFGGAAHDDLPLA